MDLHRHRLCIHRMCAGTTEEQKRGNKMSKKVIKGWICTPRGEDFTWSKAHYGRLDVALHMPDSVCKYKGTKLDAEEAGYDFPPQRVTITIEIDDGKR